MALEAHGVSVWYQKAQAVRGADVTVRPGSITGLVGPNGAGKSSLLQALQGVVRSHTESIILKGRSIAHLSPTERVKAGLVLVPQGRRIFPHLSVRDNLLVVANAFALGRHTVDAALERFQILRTRQKSPAGVMSGGEQQMLALARALMCDPSVLLLDEPTLGLAPTIVRDVVRVLTELRAEGKSIVIAEPTLRILPQHLDLGLIIIGGKIVCQCAGDELAQVYQAQFESSR
jgi:branched-chain amino acid transport system ATP-binding protein